MLAEPVSDDVRAGQRNEAVGASPDLSLPGEWRNIITRRGPLPVHPDERRRYIRYWFPVQAVLHLNQSIPAVERQEARHRVVAKTISRSGISFVHCFALYPGEYVRLTVESEELTAVVRRCLRINAACFEIGAELIRAVQ